MSHFSESFLERFSCKIMVAVNNIFRFAVAILFVYISSRNFYTSPDGTWDQGWKKSLSVSAAIHGENRLRFSPAIKLAAIGI